MITVMRMMRAVQSNLSWLIALNFFSAQVVFGSVEQSNLWAERSQKQTARIIPSSSDLHDNPSLEISQLPTSFLRAPSLPPHGPTSARLQQVVEAIPFANGSIQEIFDAETLSGPITIVLQDVHLNSEAQSNAALILSGLLDRLNVEVIGVEGAFNEFDFSAMRSAEDKVRLNRMARILLSNSRIAAPSFVGITTGTPPRIVGVDDMESYDANVQAYLDSRNYEAQARLEIAAIRLELDRAKTRYYSKEMKKLDRLRRSYRDGKISFGLYVERLAAYRKDLPGPINRFVEAHRLESSLDLAQADRQRKIVLEKLARVLTDTENRQLLSFGLSYRAGDMSIGAFYHELKDICERKGIVLTSTPDFHAYLRYVLLADTINAQELFAAVKSLERETTSALARGLEEERISHLSDRTDAIEKLVTFSLVPSEWADYREKGGDLNDIRGSLAEISTLNGPARLNNLSLTPFEEFYRQTDRRSEKMLLNLESLSATNVQVLVAGGFHTAEITKILRARNKPYLVVSPKITKVDTSSGSAYLSAFVAEKTALDKLFMGDRLFVNPGSVEVGSSRWFQTRGFRNVDRQMAEASLRERWIIQKTSVGELLPGLGFIAVASIVHLFGASLPTTLIVALSVLAVLHMALWSVRYCSWVSSLKLLAQEVKITRSPPFARMAITLLVTSLSVLAAQYLYPNLLTSLGMAASIIVILAIYAGWRSLLSLFGVRANEPGWWAISALDRMLIQKTFGLNHRLTNDNSDWPFATMEEFVVGERNIIRTNFANPCIICTVHLPDRKLGIIVHFTPINSNTKQSYHRLRDALLARGASEEELRGASIRLFGYGNSLRSGETAQEIREGFRLVWGVAIPAENEDFREIPFQHSRGISLNTGSGRWADILQANPEWNQRPKEWDDFVGNPEDEIIKGSGFGRPVREGKQSPRKAERFWRPFYLLQLTVAAMTLAVFASRAEASTPIRSVPIGNSKERSMRDVPVDDVLGPTHSLNLSSIAAPVESIVSGIRQTKDIALLVDEEMLKTLTPEAFSVLSKSRLESGPWIVAAKSKGVAEEVLRRFNEGTANLGGGIRRPLIVVNHKLFSDSGETAESEIDVDQLEVFLAEKRRVPVKNALFDICVLSASTTRYHTRDDRQRAFIKNLVSAGQLVFVSLNRSILAALAARVSA